MLSSGSAYEEVAAGDELGRFVRRWTVAAVATGGLAPWVVILATGLTGNPAGLLERLRSLPVDGPRVLLVSALGVTPAIVWAVIAWTSLWSARASAWGWWYALAWGWVLELSFYGFPFAFLLPRRPLV